jgi:hypothetical protein
VTETLAVISSDVLGELELEETKLPLSLSEILGLSEQVDDASDEVETETLALASRELDAELE